MKQNKLKSTVLWTSFLFFACVNGATGAILYFHQEFLDPQRWEGWVLAAAPMGAWLLFAMVIAMIKTEPEHKAKGTAEPATEDEEVKETPGGEGPPPVTPEPEKEPPAEELYPKEIAVVQLLGLLQREGRLLDFLEEDIEPYDDAQIGAAVRQVHRGCRAALNDALGLKPVLDASEGTEVEIEEDFDPTKIRLIGNVHGNPPFKGIIRHSGWRYTKIDLPKWTAKGKTDVLAPAEVEIT